MPHLRARQANLRGQIDALDAQSADRDAYLKLADNLESFLTQLNSTAATASIPERQRVLRLLVKDVLVGPEKITIRHRIPARGNSSATRQHDDDTDTESDHGPGYPLRWGRDSSTTWSVRTKPGSAWWARTESGPAGNQTTATEWRPRPCGTRRCPAESPGVVVSGPRCS
jgi:hypothetical protein